MFRGEILLRLFCTQFLCTLNIFLGDNQEISKNEMNEFYQNLSIQALNKNNSEVLLSFYKMTKLLKQIKMRHEDIIRQNKNTQKNKNLKMDFILKR